MCTDAFQSRRVQKSIQTYGCIWPEAMDSNFLMRITCIFWYNCDKMYMHVYGQQQQLRDWNQFLG